MYVFNVSLCMCAYQLPPENRYSPYLSREAWSRRIICCIKLAKVRYSVICIRTYSSITASGLPLSMLLMCLQYGSKRKYQ